MTCIPDILKAQIHMVLRAALGGPILFAAITASPSAASLGRTGHLELAAIVGTARLRLQGFSGKKGAHSRGRLPESEIQVEASFHTGLHSQIRTTVGRPEQHTHLSPHGLLRKAGHRQRKGA